MSARRVVILGSTGSVGRQAVDVIREHPGEFEVIGLGAGGGNVEVLARQITELQPRVVAVSDERAAARLRAAVASLAPGVPGAGTEYLFGADANAEIAAVECDVVLNGITGAVGLSATLATLRAGTTLALANKESLVIGGDLVLAIAGPGQIVPVDSEHSALAQALRGGRATEVRRLIVTATGGPFRGRRLDDLRDVTVEQALAHPKWSMGPVITINSATMANKGLEVIEAHLLFGIPYDDITVVVHPQAYIHSMVEFVDGSTIAQVNPPDLRLPIALGLKWPDRMADVVPGIDWSVAHAWEICPLDEQQTPMVRLARAAGVCGGVAPAVYNAANEVCVDAFLDRRIPFTGIHEVVEETMATYDTPGGQLTLESLLGHDADARGHAQKIIDRRFL
ncbi:1-deoxy-D-xylulose-5-phosphate reductoisomerase [Micromonospora maritima]|uniref:1-deoxy-D-xylulose-5-phosphate reductoisomerase n=1 Tax=Micromonospora maritima TaxID=986711 RepID=UPI0037A99D03